MNKIELTYKRNSANKFDFKAIQNGNLIYGKTYSPKEDDNQVLMGEILVQTAQEWADKEIERNPEFKWHSFEEFKEWIGNAQLRKEASKRYDDLMFKEWYVNEWIIRTLPELDCIDYNRRLVNDWNIRSNTRTIRQNYGTSW